VDDKSLKVDDKSLKVDDKTLKVDDKKFPHKFFYNVRMNSNLGSLKK
jgi:hypothetical protein